MPQPFKENHARDREIAGKGQTFSLFSCYAIVQPKVYCEAKYALNLFSFRLEIRQEIQDLVGEITTLSQMSQSS